MIVSCDNPSLFMAGLPIGILPGKVREMFEHINIETAYTQIMRRNKGVPMQYASALIRLADVDDSERAIKALNGVVLDGHAIKVRKFITEKPNRQPVQACYHAPEHPTWAAHRAGLTNYNA